jgi:tetratricopeptide (TPR) repeat protein
MKKSGVIILLSGLSLSGFAQNGKPQKSTAIIIAAKPLTYDDSTRVKELYFSALREKTIENYKLANELFKNVLEIDPANDATMYELASLQKIQNKGDAARTLLEQAVTVNPDNEWYWIALADSYEKITI